MLSLLACEFCYGRCLDIKYCCMPEIGHRSLREKYLNHISLINFIIGGTLHAGTRKRLFDFEKELPLLKGINRRPEI